MSVNNFATFTYDGDGYVLKDIYFKGINYGNTGGGTPMSMNNYEQPIFQEQFFGSYQYFYFHKFLFGIGDIKIKNLGIYNNIKYIYPEMGDTRGVL